MPSSLAEYMKNLVMNQQVRVLKEALKTATGKDKDVLSNAIKDWTNLAESGFWDGSLNKRLYTTYKEKHRSLPKGELVQEVMVDMDKMMRTNGSDYFLNLVNPLTGGTVDDFRIMFSVIVQRKASDLVRDITKGRKHYEPSDIKEDEVIGPAKEPLSILEMIESQNLLSNIMSYLRTHGGKASDEEVLQVWFEMVKESTEGEAYQVKTDDIIKELVRKNKIRNPLEIRAFAQSVYRRIVWIKSMVAKYFRERLDIHLDSRFKIKSSSRLNRLRVAAVLLKFAWFIL